MRKGAEQAAWRTKITMRRKCGIIHFQIRDEELVLAEYYEEKLEKER